MGLGLGCGQEAGKLPSLRQLGPLLAFPSWDLRMLSKPPGLLVTEPTQRSMSNDKNEKLPLPLAVHTHYWKGHSQAHECGGLAALASTSGTHHKPTPRGSRGSSEKPEVRREVKPREDKPEAKPRRAPSAPREAGGVPARRRGVWVPCRVSSWLPDQQAKKQKQKASLC